MEQSQHALEQSHCVPVPEFRVTVPAHVGACSSVTDPVVTVPKRHFVTEPWIAGLARDCSSARNNDKM